VCGRLLHVGRNHTLNGSPCGRRSGIDGCPAYCKPAAAQPGTQISVDVKVVNVLAAVRDEHGPPSVT